MQVFSHNKLLSSALDRTIESAACFPDFASLQAGRKVRLLDGILRTALARARQLARSHVPPENYAQLTAFQV